MASKGRRHDYGAYDKGGDCRRCEAENRRANEEAEAERARSEKPSPSEKTRSSRVRLVATLAADLLAKTPTPLTDDEAVRLAVALVDGGWRRARKGGL